MALKRTYDTKWSFWVCFALGKVVWRACECFLSVLSLTKTSILSCSVSFFTFFLKTADRTPDPE